MSIEPRDLIRTIRIARRMTQLELGRAVGVSNVRVSHIELGYVNPRPDELARITRVLGLDERDTKLVAQRVGDVLQAAK